MTDTPDTSDVTDTTDIADVADAPHAAVPAESAGAADTAQPHRTSTLTIALGVIAAIALIAAVIGFALYAQARVPASAAAKVDDTYIAEEDVADWIYQYRTANSLTDDADFAYVLLYNNSNVTSFRQTAINQLAANELILQRAEELGVMPSDEDIQAEYDANKQTYAQGDDEVWASTMETYGLTEDGLKEQYRINLAEEAVYEADVAREDATDDEVLSYMQSYVADTTQKHVYRILFTGDDASDRAQECYEALRAEDEMDTETFSEYAIAYSDEDDVASTGGSYAWSGSDMNDEVKEIVENLDVGSFSETNSIEEDDAIEIIYCDSDYTFPASDELDSLPTDVPDELMEEVREAATDTVWSDACDSYLATLIANAKITYYPVPDGADYNVDMSLAYSSDAESEDTE